MIQVKAGETLAVRSRSRIRILVHGAVQGVGFRPFVFRLAKEMGLNGWALNSADGLSIEVEGRRQALNIFLRRLRADCPSNATIRSLDWLPLTPTGDTTFKIRHSIETGRKTVQVLPDLATCPECLAEMFDSTNRRYRYPFTNCTHCGPRFSIIEALPYDRANTTMRKFQMCSACRNEYRNPEDRRFHAQPIACPDCGPQLALWDNEGRALATRDDALRVAVRAILDGQIVALKGLGGFQLLCDARNEKSVRELRRRKRREEKPFALMFPNIESARAECEISDAEQRLLLSAAAPITLLTRREGVSRIAPSVAPQNPTLGVMLPYTPLHTLCLKELNFPIVATSGNLAEEPICVDEHEALTRLRDIAHLFLVHDRPIARPLDDSVVKVAAGRPLLLRGARGYAPLAIQLKDVAPGILAVGGHLKNTVAITAGRCVFLSQHLGDLESRPACNAFLKAANDLPKLYDIRPQRIAHDLHPDYFSTRHAHQSNARCVAAQHHHAHIVSCLAEHDLDGEVLGVCWDGSGYGPDGTVWGGEFLLATRASFRRAGFFRTFQLPGGDQAAREPRRSALGVLYEIFGEKIFNDRHLNPVRAWAKSELPALRAMLAKGVNTPRASSVGRLFDAVASLVGLNQKTSFEGQAAMTLEFALNPKSAAKPYPISVKQDERGIWIVDWEPMIREILYDLRHAVSVARIALKFHNALIEALLVVAQRLAKGLKARRVALSGGCFQNRYLLERAIRRLKEAGFKPYWNQLTPPNDGGISLGQAVIAISQREGRA
ncbi:MAG: carbamoyltransferase HypF [Planctomycetota bacterium]